MIHEESLYRELFVGLLSLGEYSFPKSCPKCGRVYATLSDLLRQTDTDIRDGGVVQHESDQGEQVIGVFRNCPCGGSLNVLFKDRRDTSPEGVRRRETFGQLLDKLKTAGVETEVARRELLNLLHGRPSDILQRLLAKGKPAAG
jgi:hypothetical protein